MSNKSTKSFRKTIQDHLNHLAITDNQLSDALKNPKKSIEDCSTYILNQVKNSGNNGFADVEIFGMAIHYYTEKDVKTGDKIECQVVINRKVELTDKEKSEARQEAIDAEILKAKDTLAKKNAIQKAPEPVKEESGELTLF